ncbi:MAG: NAD(P)-binding protein [Pseudomonadota bacterium]
MMGDHQRGIGGDRDPDDLGRDLGIRILGAGCAGFGASYKLAEEGLKPVIYEAHSHVGGHTSSFNYGDGFIFDEGPHISFTKDKRIQELFAESVGGEYEAFPSRVNNYWKGHWIKHPAQINLAGLPQQLIVDCIKDFVHAKTNDFGEINNYQDWLHAAFGPTFADTFPGEYTKKYHTTEAKNLTTDWLGPRLYQPDLEEVLNGALSKDTHDVHYIPDFRYPTHGGFVSYLNMFQKRAEIHLDHRVTVIDMKERLLTFASGTQAPFEKLVSSIPLPALIPLIKHTPQDVREAASLLSCSQVVLVNIGLNRADISDNQWTYFYDEDIPFSRLSFPHTFSPNVAPKGCGAIQAEIYFSDKWKPMSGTCADLIEPTIESLLKVGLVKDRSEIIHKSTLYAPWGNVIFDHDRPRCLKLVHDYLDDIGLAYCGRYGDWAYIWTDQSFISGERAAMRVMRQTAEV